MHAARSCSTRPSRGKSPSNRHMNVLLQSKPGETIGKHNLGLRSSRVTHNNEADLLAPGFAAHLVPWIQLPTLFGEGSLCLWLLVVGVDVERWKERARAAIRMQSTQVEATQMKA